MSKWMFLIAAIALFPFCAGKSGLSELLHQGVFSYQQLYGLLYVTVGSAFVAFLLVTVSLKYLRPTTVSMYNYVQPLVACAIAIIIGQDVFSVEKLSALLLVCAGVYLVTTSRGIVELQTIKNNKNGIL